MTLSPQKTSLDTERPLTGFGGREFLEKILLLFYFIFCDFVTSKTPLGTERPLTRFKIQDFHQKQNKYKYI